MAYFAELDNNNVVLRIIAADTKEWCEGNLGGTWVQTSYNTFGGKHNLGGTPLHKNYAGIGYTFDGIGFAAPQPFPSWKLNNNTYLWEAPVPKPIDDKLYQWDEDSKTWVEVSS